MATSIIAGNWKMNTTVEEAKRLATSIKSRLENIDGVESVICPPFVSLASVSQILRDSRVMLGAQNMWYRETGAYTGEVSPVMIADLCQFVILGHSERRQFFGETDEVINSKIESAIRIGLKPILCVGEGLREREQGKAKSVVEDQLRVCLDAVDEYEVLAVAYEPIWAIGTGNAATPDVAQDMMSHVRTVMASLFGEKAASIVPLLYGGSVNSSNIFNFMQQEDINGALVGSASLDPDSFAEITQIASQMKA